MLTGSQELGADSYLTENRCSLHQDEAKDLEVDLNLITDEKTFQNKEDVNTGQTNDIFICPQHTRVRNISTRCFSF